MSRTQIQSPDIATGIVTSEKLAVTGVAAGTYSFATFTVNSKGQLTSAYSGSVSPGLVSPFYLNDLTDVVVPSPKNGQLLEFDGTNWVNAVRPSNEPIGHEDYTESTMSFDEGTRTFSIGPVSGSHTVWCTGVRYIKTTTETITIPDTTALYYIYYSSTGVLSYKTTFFTWDQDTPIAYIYWNADDNKAYYFSEERHGITLDWATHEYLHRTRGAAYASGFGVNNYTTTGNGSLDSHAQIDLANGTFFDEDLQIDITHSLSPVPNTFQQHIQSPGRFPIFYRTGSVWKRHSPTDFPIFYTTEANYNLNSGGSWSPVTLANNRYGISWLVATNNLTYPAMVVLGQGEYTNEAEYAAASWSDLDLSGFPSVEFRPLHKIVYQTSTAYANTPKSTIVAVYDLRTILPSGGVTSAPVSDHGALTGLGDDDHLQYLTSPRANTWLATKTTSNLTEGSNLYYTDERVQDAVGGMVSPSSTIRWTYNDAAGKIQAFLSPANVDHGSLGGLGDDDHTQYLTSPRANTWLGTKSIGALADVSPSAPTNGQVLTYHNASGQWRNQSPTVYITDHGALTGLADDDHLQYLTSPRANTWLASKTTSNLNEGSNLYYTDERVQDAVGAMVSPSSTIRWSYNDTAGKIQAFVSPANISHASLSNLTTGDPHTQYQLRSEENSANGYMGLDASGRASPTRLGSGTPTSTVWLRGDGVWASVPFSPADAITVDAVSVKNPNFESTPSTTPLNAILVTWGLDNSTSPVDVYGYVAYSGLNTWLGTKTTSNLTEGSNLYYTDERAQDAFGAMVSPSSTIRWSYNDVAGKIQAFVSPANIDHGALGGLTDDDHPQYLTSPRANTWLATKTTSNLLEGTNLYYTDERAQDAFGAMVSPSSTIRWSYNDTAGKIQAFVSPANIDHGALGGLGDDDHTQYLTSPRANTWLGTKSIGALSDVSPSTPTNGQVLTYHNASGQWRNQSPTVYVTDHGALTGLADDDHLQYLTSPRANTWLSTKTTSNLTEGSNLYYTDERVQDAVGAMVSPSSTIRWSYNDTAGKIQAFVSPANIDHGSLGGLTDDDHLQYLTSPRANTWLATKTTSNLTEGSNQYFTDERAQDAVALALTNTSTVKWTYNDGSNTIAADVSPAGISHASLANLTTGDPHTQYQLESEKNAANGYAGLNSSGLLSPSRIPGMPLSFLTDVSPGTPTNGQVLTYHTSSSQWRSQSPIVYVTDHGALTGLGDDDHTQYLTSPRANTWLASKTTSNLTEGSNLYYTDERVQDAVGGMVSPSSTVRWSYNDTAGKIQAFVSPANIDHGALGGLADDDHLQYLTSPRANTWLATKTTSNLTEGSNQYFTDERAQDAVALALTNTSTIKWTYNDGSNLISADVSPAGISHASLANLTTGDPHTQYQLESEKNANNGYAGLDAAGKISSPQLHSSVMISYKSNTLTGSIVLSSSGGIDAEQGELIVPLLSAGSGSIFIDNEDLVFVDRDVIQENRVEVKSRRNALSGYAGLDAAGRVSPSRIPGMPLSFLTDVSPSTPLDGQALIYHAASGQWRNSTLPTGVTDHGLLTGLADDDHTQYLTSPRANTWLATKTTSNLTEGSNLYYTDERVQDAVGAMMSPSSTIRWSYNDTVGKMQAFVSPANISHTALSNLTTGDPHTQYQLESEKNAANGYMGLDSNGRASPTRLGSGTPTSAVWLRGDGAWASVPFSPADAITVDATAVKNPNFESTPGTPPLNSIVVTWGLDNMVSPVDVYGYITYSGLNTWLSTKTTSNLTEGSNLYYTDERAQDAFGAMVSPSTTIRWSYNDTAGKIQAFVSPANISHASLANLTSGDPHTQYQLKSEKNAANGYAGLNSSGLLSPSRIPGMPLSFLTDVSPSTPVDGQALIYHAASGQWRNSTLPTGVTDHGLLSGLADDDHTQYLTSPRADSWLSTKTTSNLTEGSNLYYLDERAQDAFGAMVSPSTTIRWSYNDTAGKIQAFVSPANISHAALSNLTTGDPHTQYQLKSEKNAANGYAGLNASGLLSPSRIPGMPLSFLTDVSPQSVANGQVLTYHAASAQWRNQSPIGVEDHGMLAGLGDDDHVQYAMLDGTRSFEPLGLKIFDSINTYSLVLQNSSSQASDHTLNLYVESPTIDLIIKGSTTLRAGGDHAGTNTGDVTLTGTPDYITISGQTITRGQIDLATDVTGDLPLSNLAQSSAASRLLGRGSASGAGDFQEITLGSGLSMSGTTLSSTGGATNLDALTDVSPGTPTNGQVLTYNSSSGQWQSQSPTVGAGSGLTQAQVLKLVSFRG